MFDKDMDAIVDPICRILTENGYTTLSSCQGHPFGGHITFISDGIPDWADHLMNEILLFCNKENMCLGCIRLRIEYHIYSDCSNTLKKNWNIFLQFRSDYSKTEAKEHGELTWSEVYKILEKFFNKK